MAALACVAESLWTWSRPRWGCLPPARLVLISLHYAVGRVNHDLRNPANDVPAFSAE